MGIRRLIVKPMPTNTPSIGQLKRAVEIAEKIETLQAELASLFGGSPAALAKVTSAKPSQKSGRRTLSAEARAKIAASTRARWARIKGTGAPSLKAAPSAAKPAAAAKKKGGLTDEGRARLAAMMKARWAAKRKGTSAPSKPAATSAGAKNARRAISPESRARMIAGAKRRWAAKKK